MGQRKAKNQFIMDEDEDYVVNEHESDEEIADLEDAIEDEFVPDAAEPEDDVLSDYADENESVSAEEESSDEEDPKKRRKKKKKDHDDEWNLKSEEERNLKPYKMADKYTKARLQVDQLCAPSFYLCSGEFGFLSYDSHSNSSFLCD